MPKGTIIIKDGQYRYYDKNGKEITEGCRIVYPNDKRIYKVYRTEDGELGTDATNPYWIEIGRAVECEYGIYPLNDEDVKIARVIHLHLKKED